MGRCTDQCGVGVGAGAGAGAGNAEEPREGNTSGAFEQAAELLE